MPSMWLFVMFVVLSADNAMDVVVCNVVLSANDAIVSVVCNVCCVIS